MWAKASEEKSNKDAMVGSVKKFSKSAFIIPRKCENRTFVKWTTWIAFAQLCCMQYRNDVRYYFGRKYTDIVRRPDPRQNNVSVVQIICPGSRSELRLFGTEQLTLCALLIENRCFT